MHVAIHIHTGIIGARDQCKSNRFDSCNRPLPLTYLKRFNHLVVL